MSLVWLNKRINNCRVRKRFALKTLLKWSWTSFYPRRYINFIKGRTPWIFFYILYFSISKLIFFSTVLIFEVWPRYEATSLLFSHINYYILFQGPTEVFRSLPKKNRSRNYKTKNPSHVIYIYKKNSLFC